MRELFLRRRFFNHRYLFNFRQGKGNRERERIYLAQREAARPEVAAAEI
jgi:hypothetical protein